MTPRVDVLIVGYGPVGAALAGLLGRYGVQTLVVDKAEGIFMAPRAIALDNEALRILQMVGLSDDAFPRVPIPFVRMISPLVGEFARLDMAGESDGHPLLVTFYQPELEQALRANAEAQPSVQARNRVELVRFSSTPDGVEAVLRDADGEHTVHAAYLVGADGAHSSVRRAIGQDFEGRTYPEDWLIVDATGVPGDFDHVEFLCDPARPTPHMVAPGGRTRWEFMLHPGEDPATMESDETIAELLRPWGSPDEIRIERRAVYRFHARACARFSEGRVFLAGDAAHVTPPFVGQGLVAGLRDAANLAWKLAWVLRGAATPAILESYDQERRPHANKMITLARFAGGLVMPKSRLRALLVHGTARLLRMIPGLRAYLDRGGIKPKNSYPEGLFASGRGRLSRGAWLAQGRLGDGTRSDDALGMSLVAVGCGGDPAQHLSPAMARAWGAAGGQTRAVGPSGAAWAHGIPEGWCVVVRPDRTILHDGPLAGAERLLREALAVLGTDLP